MNLIALDAPLNSAPEIRAHIAAIDKTLLALQSKPKGSVEIFSVRYQNADIEPLIRARKYWSNQLNRVINAREGRVIGGLRANYG